MNSHRFLYVIHRVRLLNQTLKCQRTIPSKTPSMLNAFSSYPPIIQVYTVVSDRIISFPSSIQSLRRLPSIRRRFAHCPPPTGLSFSSLPELPYALLRPLLLPVLTSLRLAQQHPNPNCTNHPSTAHAVAIHIKTNIWIPSPAPISKPG